MAGKVHESGHGVQPPNSLRRGNYGFTEYLLMNEPLAKFLAKVSQSSRHVVLSMRYALASVVGVSLPAVHGTISWFFQRRGERCPGNQFR